MSSDISIRDASTTVIRSDEEIVERIKSIQTAGEDFFGAQHQNLVGALPDAQARPYLKAEYTDPWTPRDSYTDACDYLTFAFDKAYNERGLSAERSIDHYRAWLWLLCDDDTFSRWNDMEYRSYGLPQLIVAAALLNITIPLPGDFA